MSVNLIPLATCNNLEAGSGKRRHLEKYIHRIVAKIYTYVPSRRANHLSLYAMRYAYGIYWFTFAA